MCFDTLFRFLAKPLHGFLPYPPGHFYSPIPSRRSLCVPSKDLRFLVQSDIVLNEELQLKMLHQFIPYYNDMPFRERRSPEHRYYLDNGWFAYSDGIFLHCMLRNFMPQRIVEVGSGFSSACILDTIDHFDNARPTVDFIEPAPKRLFSLLRHQDRQRCNVHIETVQSIDKSIFTSLGSGDFLVIDSSHVLKYGSDLHAIFFDILPILNKGVVVHFHDIFNGFEYPQRWIKQGRFWNEAYILRSFLAYNSAWEIVLFNDFVNAAFSDLVHSKFPLCVKNSGGSIYIRKIN
jgi:hypothetical protein